MMMMIRAMDVALRGQGGVAARRHVQSGAEKQEERMKGQEWIDEGTGKMKGGIERGLGWVIKVRGTNG